MDTSCHVIDVTNLQCPLPLLKAKQAISKLNEGELLLVKVTDPSSERDFKAWTTITVHTLVELTRVDNEIHYLLRKGN